MTSFRAKAYSGGLGMVTSGETAGFETRAHTLRKRAAHWRRVALLTKGVLVTRFLRSRASSLEIEAERLERCSQAVAQPSQWKRLKAVWSGE